MIKYVILTVLGIIMIALGAVNCKGNISSIHSYNRRNVSENDIPKYGKCVGIGTVICGSSLLVTVLLEIILRKSVFDIVIPIGLVIGLAFIIYGQFKYNKGIF